MRINFFEPLKCIPKSMGLMLVYPAWTLGLLLIAVSLSIGASALSKHLGLPDQPLPDDIRGILQRSLVNLAVLFPLEMYFIPRWIMATDAFTLGGASSRKDWKQLFEERWFRVFLARILVALAASLGFFMCLVPGLLVMLFFGWTPWRVLLQGETISDAAKASAKAMALLWPQVSMTVAVIILIVLVGNDLATFASSRLGHSLGWHVSNVFSQLSIIWMNAALLSLYQWMEPATERLNINTNLH